MSKLLKKIQSIHNNHNHINIFIVKIFLKKKPYPKVEITKKIKKVY